MIRKTVVRLCGLTCTGALVTSLATANGDQNQEALAAIMAIESDKEYGAYLSAECLACHTPDGASNTIPQVHGKEKADLVNALLEYKLKQRENLVMQGIAGSLSNEDIAALATYLSAE